MSKLLKSLLFFTLIIAGMLQQACTSGNEQKNQFELLSSETTGLSFSNTPVPTLYLNAFNFMYFYNGGGLAVGDFNNDGLQDVFFTANMEANKIFLNEGNFTFKDVTEIAGMEGQDGWTTGTTVIDINNDGLLDIYVCQIGEYATVRGKNQLYVCQGIENNIPIYKNEAASYGLDFSTFSTQASFFDYDLDGDLDMYLMNYSLHQNGTFGQRKSFIGKMHPISGDRLLKNEGGTFVDVTASSGIHSMVIGYGLGISTSDINLDGWPDIYIGNDFHENDYLYINQQDGTFEEVITDQMMHTSRFSMGVDVGDVNNDGLSDIFSLDMLPEDPIILKSSLGEDELGVFNFKLGYGYQHQYARNNLQLNNGNGTFSEIGMFSGVYATDWSWTPLLFDFNHDGYKDLFISNGIPRRMNDIDYINYRELDSDFKWKAQLDNLEEKDLVAMEKMPEIKLPNKFYTNNKNLQFTDIGDYVINNINTYSNGSAYADFDNDGDLDIITNNSMDNPFIYKNLSIENQEKDANYLAINFEGPSENIDGIGAKVVVFKEDQILNYENFPVRGYQSNVQLGLNIGLGDTLSIDSIIVIWPNHNYERLRNVQYNKSIEVTYKNELNKIDFGKLRLTVKPPINFSEVTDTGLEFVHEENQFVEFKRNPLIPNKFSIDGPAMAVGDINNDGLDDVYIGGSKRRKGALFIQNQDTSFSKLPQLIIENDSTFEDVDAVFVDIENDGDLDLVVASGGNEYWGESDYLTQRIYINDGSGDFSEKVIFEDIFMTASCVLPNDFNNDGLIDFFIGGRAVPKLYGIPPTSYLLLNKGNRDFEIVTEQYSDDLANIGFVKDGQWTDIDQDGDNDLILALEWESIKIVENNGGSFEVRDLSDEKGWWNFVLPYDYDQDGDIDLIAGNAGENIKFKPTDKEPLRLYINDFDNDGELDQVMTYYVGDREIPFANYAELTNRFPFLKEKFPSSRDFAAQPLNKIFSNKSLNESVVLEVNQLSSVLFENLDNGDEFKTHRLPNEIQFSSLEAGAIIGSANDDVTNVVVGGNFYGATIEMGRSDASYGNLITIQKDNTVKAHSLGDVSIKGQVREVSTITINGNEFVLVAINDEGLLVLQPN